MTNDRYGKGSRWRCIVFYAGRVDGTEVLRYWPGKGHGMWGEDGSIGGCKDWKQLLESYEVQTSSEAHRGAME